MAYNENYKRVKRNRRHWLREELKGSLPAKERKRHQAEIADITKMLKQHNR